MTSEVSDMTLKAIGVVRNEMKKTGARDYSEVVSELMIDESLKDALIHIDDFSHVIVLYWMHIDNHPGEPRPLTSHPHRNPENPLVGLFSNRNPDRPNRIGLCLSKVVELQGNILKVTMLDAIDGTAIIDIKPYIPRIDAAPDAKVASWVGQPRPGH